MSRKLFMRNDPVVVKAATDLSLEEFKEKFKENTSEETLEKAYAEIRKKAGLNTSPKQREVNVEKDEPLESPSPENEEKPKKSNSKKAAKAKEPEPEEVEGEEETTEEEPELVSEFTAEDGAKVSVSKLGKTAIVETEEPAGEGEEEAEGTEDNSDEVAAGKGKGKVKAKKEKVPKEKKEGAGRRSPEEMEKLRTLVKEGIDEGLTDGAIVKKLAEQGIKTYPPQVKGIRESLSEK